VAAQTTESEAARTHVIGFRALVLSLVWAAFDALLPFFSLTVYAGGIDSILNTSFTRARFIATFTRGRAICALYEGESAYSYSNTKTLTAIFTCLRLGFETAGGTPGGEKADIAAQR
jgi:hypothetical protein